VIVRRFQDIEQNLRFLVVEVTKQVDRTLHTITNTNNVLRLRFKSYDDYIDQLKGTIENACFMRLRQSENLDKRTVTYIRSMLVIASNLEHIADHAVDIVEQATRLNDKRFLERYDYRPFFSRVLEALSLVFETVMSGDTSGAIRIAKAELALDELYRDKFERILVELTTGPEDAPNLISSLNIFSLLERMGDCLLNIAEAVLLLKTGERLKIRHYNTLQETLTGVAGSDDSDAGGGDAKSSADDEVERDFDFEGIWGTRSGCRIGKVSASNGKQPNDVIYKEGDRKKMYAEVQKIELWSKLAPSIPPRVVEYRETDNGAVLLIEFLAGRNLKEILVSPDDDLTGQALECLVATLDDIWTSTLAVEQTCPRFFTELAARFDDVRKIHPEANGQRQQISGLEISSFDKLLGRNLPLDELLCAPFSVLGHGDFNLDNIIFNRETEEIHFIDLHRSDTMDYVRDVAVFLVSSYRLPVFDPEVRRRIRTMTTGVLEFARRFAARHDDETFELRLAAGLARSLATSLRFELSGEFSKDMLDRSRYLVEKVYESATRAPASFELPCEVLEL
jgi:phosphate uptake regulator/aminoglycoside phosphotransferase